MARWRTLNRRKKRAEGRTSIEKWLEPLARRAVRLMMLEGAARYYGGIADAAWRKWGEVNEVVYVAGYLSEGFRAEAEKVRAQPL